MLDTLRRLGQRVLVGFDGLAASPHLKRLIRDFGVGQVILFARNVEGPAQVAELCREIQSAARMAGHDLPVLISVDQEGGRVARLQAPWTVWPPMRALGRIGREDFALRVGQELAAELLACGIRLDFAPDMDVDTNPQNPIIGDRALSGDPALVARLGVAMIRGFQEARVAACAKHFPGHGDTTVDSHLELPVVDHPRRRIEEIELAPFRAAIAAGVATIMTAHVLVRDLDPDQPATLSPIVIGGMLRKQLGYGGVIVSDDLEMKAVANLDAPGRLAVRAARAGCDVLAVCSQHDAQVQVIEELVHALESGELPWGEAEDADARVRRLKHEYLLPYEEPDPRLALAAAGRGQVLARQIADQGGYEL
jgi:beta-N-acetylhexosaminidase